jgi:uncharacterized protein
MKKLLFAVSLTLTAATSVSPLLSQTANPEGAPAEAAAPASYAEEIQKWQEARETGLKREDGWLSLVGLYWLSEGENRFGADAGLKVILPEGRGPAEAGVLVRTGDRVVLRPAKGVEIKVAGHPVIAEIELNSDATGDPTVVELGPLRFFLIRRGDRLGVRIKDPEGPARKNFHGIDRYSVDTSWRVEARFEKYDPPKSIQVPNILGWIDDTPSPGAVVFERDGKTHRLDVVGGTAEEELFLVFGDETNGGETYGAGRFLATDPPKDGKVWLDFNKSYNPPCAFTAFATCPLPPKQNRLALRVVAGEKNYQGAAH